mmetsp:Transcript_25167/g.39512  ORF Transcript_25167/g.39512 Transcript_25167/m.39512 type:complete len:110 (+) Transcript_25167:184-513(+)
MSSMSHLRPFRLRLKWTSFHGPPAPGRTLTLTITLLADGNHLSPSILKSSQLRTNEASGSMLPRLGVQSVGLRVCAGDSGPLAETDVFKIQPGLPRTSMQGVEGNSVQA